MGSGWIGLNRVVSRWIGFDMICLEWSGLDLVSSGGSAVRCSGVKQVSDRSSERTRERVGDPLGE